MSILWFIIELILVILAIDLLSGIVHWAEDTFGTEKTPVVGKWIVIPNVVHHHSPLEFTKKSWWASSWDLLLVSALGIVVAWWIGQLTWHMWLFCFIGTNANQLHKYAHLPKHKVPWIVRILQTLRILQNSKHHAQHHRGEKNSAYCVVTPYMNFVLDKLRFWRLLEKILVPIFGAPRREDIKATSEQKQ